MLLSLYAPLYCNKNEISIDASQKGLVSYKSTQRLLVSLFDVFAARLFLTATMQALGAQEECKAAERSEQGKK